MVCRLRGTAAAGILATRCLICTGRRLESNVVARSRVLDGAGGGAARAHTATDRAGASITRAVRVTGLNLPTGALIRVAGWVCGGVEANCFGRLQIDADRRLLRHRGR